MVAKRCLSSHKVIPTLPVDVVDEGSQSHVNKVWGVAHVLQRSVNTNQISTRPLVRPASAAQRTARQHEGFTGPRQDELTGVLDLAAVSRDIVISLR